MEIRQRLIREINQLKELEAHPEDMEDYLSDFDPQYMKQVLLDAYNELVKGDAKHDQTAA